jgi:hypothetical protein
MRSPLWFVVAGAIALSGIVGAVYYLLPRIGSLEAKLSQAVMPGSATITLAEPGTYTIFHEQKAVVDGRYYASASADGLRLKLETAAGMAVPLSEPATNSSYSIGNRAGTSIFAFTIAEPGRYRMTGALASGRDEPKIVLAVGQGLLSGMFSLIGMTLLIFFGSRGVAGAIVAITVNQRAKARRQGAA